MGCVLIRLDWTVLIPAIGATSTPKSTIMLEHDSRQSLSDHIPITTTIVLDEEPILGRRKGTYTKMDHTFLEDVDFRAARL